MYDCQTLLKLLYPYLDGELDVKESLRVQNHLEECHYCLELFRREKDFIQILKSSVSTHKAPEGLRERLIDLLRPSAPTYSHFRSLFPFRTLLVSTLAMLVMIVVGVILYALPKQVEKRHLELVEAAVENHVGIVKGKIPFDIMSSEPSVILKWLERGLDFPVQIPQDEVSNMHLLGGRLVHLHDDKKAAFLTFESKDGKVSLLMTSPQLFQEIEGKVIPFKGIRFYMTHYRGYYALTWADPQLSYVLVSDEKARITEACRICHGNTHPQDLSGFDDQI
ncbi:MAG: zf-HC2 domain-containing protein [Nitrospira sp.]|nr:zf-HC2 domain-containing protein [Nitrospira sp.]